MNKLTYAQKEMLKRVPNEWTDVYMSCTNGTFCALERRGLVEWRRCPGDTRLSVWRIQWRKTEKAQSLITANPTDRTGGER